MTGPGPSPFQATVAQGDKWMKQAVETYEGGGDYDIAAAEAGIATAWYARAALERPDTFATLLAAAEQQNRGGSDRDPIRGPRAGMRTRRPRTSPEALSGEVAAARARLAAAEADLEAAMDRHPAGSKMPATAKTGVPPNAGVFVEDTVDAHPDDCAQCDPDADNEAGDNG